MVKHITLGSREYFQEYCNNASLHGLKYVGGEKRTLVEKLVWITLFCSAVGFCTYMIFQTYKKWENSPVIVSFSQNPTPVGAIPFPAVTICPQTKAKQSSFNFTDLHMKSMYKNITENETISYNRLKMVCDYLEMLKNTGELFFISELDKLLEKANYFENEIREESPNDNTDLNFNHTANETEFETDELVSFLLEAAPSAKDIFRACIWNTKRYKCADLFATTLNEDGICFTFNMLGDKDLFSQKVHSYKEFYTNKTVRSNWTAENGYKDNGRKIKKSYPRRVLGSGIKYGLEIKLREDEYDFDYICKSTVQGFKVILHEPGDIAKGRTQYIHVPIDQEVTIAIHPNMITTSPSLRGYSPEKRNCFFNNERRLNFFKSYTQENCELECLTLITKKKCGCVAYYMPRLSNTKLCGPKSLRCLQYVETRFLAVSVNEENEHNPPCNCMPSCHAITYNAETSQAPNEWRKFDNTMDQVNFLNFKKENVTIEQFLEYVQTILKLNITNDREKKDERHYTQLKIFFKDTQFISTERSELYGVVDFMANCGGIFGLFTGFSILSLLEVVYY